MNTNRQNRFEQFEMFYGKSKELFETLAKADPRNAEFHNNYGLNIVPGGGDGGMNKRLVEIFYGTRPVGKTIDSVGPAGGPRLTRTILVSEYGAKLVYQINDKGNVQCWLYPAETKNLGQIENAILLDWIPEPRALLDLQLLKSHWDDFMAYMQVTSLDGEPSFRDKVRVDWLRFSKHRIVDDKFQGPRWKIYAGDILKYIITVGLSGFLLMFISTCSDNNKHGGHRHHSIEHHR